MATQNIVDWQVQLIRLILVILGAVLAIVGWARWAGAQSTTPRPAVPVKVVVAIVDALRQHSVAGVTAGHGDEPGA